MTVHLLYVVFLKYRLLHQKIYYLTQNHINKKRELKEKIINYFGPYNMVQINCLNHSCIIKNGLESYLIILISNPMSSQIDKIKFFDINIPSPIHINSNFANNFFCTIDM